MSIALKKEEVEEKQEVFRKSFLKNKIFSDNFVITRDKDNNPLSRFKDDTWDLSSYKLVPKDKEKLYFGKIFNIEIKKEAKRLILLIMVYKRGVNGNMLSNDSLVKNYYNGVIFKMAKYSQKNNMSIKMLIENNIILFSFIKEEVSINSYNSFKSFLTFLYNQNNSLTNINYKRSSRLSEYLKTKHAQYRESRNQVEMIPTRIFNKIIQEKEDFIQEVYNVLDDLIIFINEILYDKNKSIINSIKSKELKNIFERYGVNSKLNISLFFYRIQEAVKLLIHAYTGMRNSEVNSLYCNCFEYVEKRDKNLKYCTISGYDTKLKGKTIEKWITSRKIEMPIYLLGKLNLHILNSIYSNSYNLSNSPLFIKRKLLYNNKNKILENNLMCNIESLNNFQEKEIMITEKDVLELEDIEPFRDWRNESEFQIGKKWTFKSHQFRRTLVIYAIQSGLVSLGTLQKQLKHLIRDMTLYYGNGASLAKSNFNISSDHIGLDMDAVRVEFNILSYIKNVIFSDKILYAAHGDFVEKNIKEKITTKKEYLLNNYETTLKMFKNGEIMYTETALGGCVSTEACNYKLLRLISPCIECSGAIIKENNLNEVIAEQKKFIETLKSNSIEYRTERKELELLINYKKNILRKNK